MYADSNGMPAAPAPALGPFYLESLWINAGGDPSIAPQMAAIALAESAGVSNNVNNADNGQSSWGLWQIGDSSYPSFVPGDPPARIPRGWDDPPTNAKMAVAKYASQGFGAWGTYGGNAFHSYLAEIENANEQNGNVYENVSSSEGGDNWFEKGVNAATGGAYDKLKGSLGSANSILGIPANVMDNFGPFAIGMLLLLIGGALLAMSWGEHLVGAIEKVADKAAPAVAAAGKAAAEGAEVLA